MCFSSNSAGVFANPTADNLATAPNLKSEKVAKLSALACAPELKYCSVFAETVAPKSHAVQNKECYS